MDNSVDNDPDEEENVLQQPMRAYNMSAINNIKLPNLELDDDVSVYHDFFFKGLLIFSLKMFSFRCLEKF